MNGNIELLHRDQLGSVKMVTAANGSVIEKSTYEPFGEANDEVLSLTAAAETKGFIGERYDADAGLQYLNARYYDPRLGMFVQPDWLDPTEPGVGLNRYGYSFNDPVNNYDPGGNSCVPCVPAAFESLKWLGVALGLIGGAAAIDHAMEQGIPASDRMVGRRHNGGPEFDPVPPPLPPEVAGAAMTAAYLASRIAGVDGNPHPKEIKTSDDQSAIQRGMQRSQLHGENWSETSLSAAVNSVAGGEQAMISYSPGKTIYTNPQNGKQVVYDRGGNYFRVLDPKASGRGRYLDPAGNPVSLNKTEIRPDGTTRQTGKSKSEFNRDSHFKNSDPTP